jgi:cyanophycinase
MNREPRLVFTAILSTLNLFSFASQNTDTTKIYPNRSASLGIIGDTVDIQTSTRLGVVMMGGA